jgi:hypothetical protein
MPIKLETETLLTFLIIIGSVEILYRLWWYWVVSFSLQLHEPLLVLHSTIPIVHAYDPAYWMLHIFILILFFFNLHSGGWSPNWVHSARRPFIGLLYLPRVIVRMGEFGGMNWQGKPKYSEKTCPGATLSTTNPTWPDPGLNPGCRGGKPATNRLSYGVAY